jgi:hypothetical protein
MKAHPILFSAPMVCALLDGRKTQTRRIMKPQPQAGYAYHVVRHDHPEDLEPLKAYKPLSKKCPYGQPGDLLWVRETWAMCHRAIDLAKIYYRACENRSHTEFHELIPVEKIGNAQPTWPRWKPSIFMPRWASRITLEIAGVRVERLQDISEADAEAEGCTAGLLDDGFAPRPIGGGYMIESPGTWASAAGKYQILWDEINGEGSWDIDPLVWMIEFKVHKQNVDRLLEARTA